MSPISKGEAWGEASGLPDGAPIADGDEQLRGLVHAHFASGARSQLHLGLRGGDLARTLGAAGPIGRDLRAGTTVTVDVLKVTLGASCHWGVAHAVVRQRWAAGPVTAVMNAQWFRGWNLGPRAHPNDGLLDIYETSMSVRQRMLARSRLASGTHVPHPDIQYRRATAAEIVRERAARVFLDHRLIGRGTSIAVEVVPDAVRVTF